jgi:hypothetical protein
VEGGGRAQEFEFTGTEGNKKGSEGREEEGIQAIVSLHSNHLARDNVARLCLLFHGLDAQSRLLEQKEGFGANQIDDETKGAAVELPAPTQSIILWTIE